jgi:hypothetical protein
VTAADQVYQSLEFGVAIRVPSSTALEHPQKGFDISMKVFLELSTETFRTQPAKPPFEGTGVKLIDLLSLPPELSLGPKPFIYPESGRFIVFFIGKKIQVPVLNAIIQEAGILGANGHGLLGLDSMKADKVSQDVPFNRLNECLPTAFQSLEKVCPAKTHKPLAGSGQIRNNGPFCGRGRLMGPLYDIIS